MARNSLAEIADQGAANIAAAQKKKAEISVANKAIHAFGGEDAIRHLSGDVTRFRRVTDEDFGDVEMKITAGAFRDERTIACKGVPDSGTHSPATGQTNT